MTTYKITEVISKYRPEACFKVYSQRVYKPWFCKPRIEWDCLQRWICGGGGWSADVEFKTKEEAQQAIDNLKARAARPAGLVINETILP